MKKIRIFISSPGDVQEERDIARGVVQQLGRTFAGRLQLQAVLWEELALGADASFQKGIDVVLSEQGVEIAVFILWSRLGSPTGPMMVGDQGRPFRSGTEREWYLMLQAREDCVKRGIPPRPQILVYTRNDDVSFEERLRGKTDEHKASDVQQKLALSQFVKEEFHDTESGVNVRAYHSFDQPTTFAKQLRTHLTNLLESTYDVALDRPYWNVDEKGPPFRGLDVFEFEHSPIFFGREDELVAIRNRLREQACRGCAFLLISGASGSGKSSLARAGVLPDIVTHEVDSDISKWRRCVLKPNQLDDGLLAGFVRCLLDKAVLPELQNWNDDLTIPVDPHRQKDWSTRFVLRVKDALSSCGNKRGATRLLVLVDQMEEFFSSSNQTSENVQQFFEVLEDLARSGFVWIIATVRSDFYHECQKIPALVRMKDGAGQFDLLAPTSDSLMRVVTGPAHLAGLRFEKSGEQSLADSIIRESASCAELLPLVEYLLLDLYEHRTADSVLTFARYQELGGLEGALRHRCEETFTTLPAQVQATLPAVLSKLVSLSGDDLNTAVRRVVPWERIRANPSELELVEAMVAQRLFTTSSDSDGTKVVSVTHEAVLRIWPRVSEWTDQNRGFLRIRSRVEQSQSRWQQQPDDSLLLASGVPLDEACQLLDQAPHLLDPETKVYIERSNAFHTAERLRRRRFTIGSAILAAVLLISVGWYGWQVRNQTRAEGIVNALVAANPVELERLIEKELPNHRGIANGLLNRISEENRSLESKPGLHARLALLPVDGRHTESLQQTLVTIPEPEYLALIVRSIKANQRTLDLWPQFHDTTLDPDQRFRAGLALASLAPDASQWTDEDAAFLVERLVQSNPVHQSIYLELLKPISERLIGPLRAVFAAPNQVQQLASANAISALTKNHPESLIEFIVTATQEQFRILFPNLSQSEDSRSSLLSIVRTHPPEGLSQSDRINLGIGRAGAAITLLRTGSREEIFDVFRVTDDPESLSQFVARCKDRGIKASQLLECVELCEAKRITATGNDRMLEDRVLYGLLLTLGDYNRDAIPEPKLEFLKSQLVEWYGTDPSSTVHGASGWLLRRWGYKAEAIQVDQTPLAYDPTGKRDWFILEVKLSNKISSSTTEKSLYFTFVVYPAGEYRLGSPADESKHGKDETQHSIQLSSPLAICDRELTWEQFDPFDEGEFRQASENNTGRRILELDPAFARNWYESITYCGWLSSLAEVSQCYDDPGTLEKDEQGNPKYSKFYLERGGLRLPTEAEWELACRAGSQSAYCFGSDPRLLENYGWYQQNSSDWSHNTGELRPNMKGLYDVHGNLYEWCHDWYTSKVDDRSIDPIGGEGGSDRVLRGGGWGNAAANCRSAYRDSVSPTARRNVIGFRLALSPSSGEQVTVAEPVGEGTKGASAEQRPEKP